MKLLSKAPDGGISSGVTGYFLVEIKGLFSVVLLKFNKGTREAFHEHAFNAVTVWLRGAVTEYHQGDIWNSKTRVYVPFMWKLTRRSVFHKIVAHEDTWALSFRGPWQDRWREDRNGEMVTLTHGRLVVSA